MDSLEQLDVASALFLRDLQGADVASRCTSLPWSVAQLAAHLGEVHTWAAGIAGGAPRTTRDAVPEVVLPVADHYAAARTTLLTALRALDPAAPAWTMDPRNRTVSFWHRRQLHETLIHLWDLRSAADPSAPPPPEFASAVYADTIDELLEVMVGRFPERGSLPAPLALESTDSERRWHLTTDWVVSADADFRVAATVSGPTAVLALFAWNRFEAEHPLLTVTGDQPVVDAFVRAVIRP